MFGHDRHQPIRCFVCVLLLISSLYSYRKCRAGTWLPLGDRYIYGKKPWPCKVQLTAHDWDGIVLVAKWLKQFRHATTKMSTMKLPMLSSTHATFRGLQKHLKTVISMLPNDTAPEIKTGLLDAHCKLSNYYYKFDQSPWNIWAACTWPWHHSPPTSHLILSVLDPHISYKGLFADFEDDGVLAEYLESSKADLYSFYSDKYLPNHSMTPLTSSQATTPALS
jgi:hypothetical protein